jgi:hypothetical protein
MMYLKVTRDRLIRRSYLVPMDEIGSVIAGEFDGSEIGDKVTLQLAEMTEEEYEALPDFPGWYKAGEARPIPQVSQA